MARYIDADRLLACLEEYGGGEPVAFVTMRQLKNAISFVEDTLQANVVVPPEREIERLKKALAAKGAEYDQALQDKARECNIAVDKICLEHREEIRALKEAHEAELAKAKIEVARLMKENEYILMQHAFQRRPDGKCWNDVIEKAKFDVEREIFAGVKLRLQNMGDKYGYKATLEPDFDQKKEYRGAQIGVYVALHSIVAYEEELRKKRTEDKP